MAVADLARSGLLLERLEVLVRSYLAEDEAVRFMAFARTFHAGTLEEDVDGRNMEDLYGALMSVRRLCETPSDQASRSASSILPLHRTGGSHLIPSLRFATPTALHRRLLPHGAGAPRTDAALDAQRGAAAHAGRIGAHHGS